MSNFKVLPAGPLAAHQQRETILPKKPHIVLPSQITLLNYPVETLTEQIHAFFDENPIDKASLLKALKVVGCSLNDNKLISSIEKILSTEMGVKNGQIYLLLALWAGQRFCLSDFLLRLTNTLRKGLLFLIFEQYFMGSLNREFGVQQQLGALLSLSSHNELLQELLKRYESNKTPLKTVVRKCMRIQSEHQALKLLTSAFIGACITGKTQRLMEFDLETQTLELEYLLQVVPSSGSALISLLKQTITEQSLSKMNSPLSSKVNAVLHSAAKEWLNQKHNYWKVVERRFTPSFNFTAKTSLQYGKMVVKEGAASECLAVQLLYSYFQGKRFDFEAGDALVADRQRQNWIQVYKAISQCSSHRLANLVLINKGLAPSWWKVSDPKKTASKAVKKLIQKHSDFLEQKQKELSLGNKKMELAFSVVIAIDKQTSQQYAVTLQQLQKWLSDGQPPIRSTFREEYPPFRPQIKAKQQAKKEHNIIIQAKLVRVLKRAKQSLSPETIAKESGYSLETVELGVKRLVSKSLAQEDGRGGYQYLA